MLAGSIRKFLTDMAYSTVVALTLMAVCPRESKAADSPYAAGVKQFSAKNYAAAAISFKKTLTAEPKNDSARYYQALSLHYSKNTVAAKKAYADLIRSCPDSNGAAYARVALSTLDPALLKTLPAAKRSAIQYARAPMPNSGDQTQAYSQDYGGGRSSSNDTLPDDCRIYYELNHGCFVIDALVNGRPMKMFFDTGASICAFGKDNLVAAGIAPPTGKSTGEAVGIGDGGAQATWGMNVDLKVGPIERRNFPVKVQTTMAGEPLLGQTFFQDFNYTIDNGAKSIHFVRKKKTSSSAYATDPSKDPMAVPFTRLGNNLVINVEVNGRPTQMYFDTGASIVTLTQAQCRSLGITIPEDAQVGQTVGIAGSTRTRHFEVQSLRVGGITVRDFMVAVPDSEMAGIGLLGQTFYSSYQYTIDYDRGYIHFMRR